MKSGSWQEPILGGWLPTRQQETLLRAALLPPVQAEADWLAWSQEVDFENDYIDQGSFRLLPMVYRNLAEQNPSLPKMCKLAGIYRRSWYQNQLIARSFSALLNQLKDAGIESLLLKGIPLSQLYYQDMGARPMADADILIPFEQLDDAVQLLQKRGWTSKVDGEGDVIKQFSKFTHALGFTNQQRVEVDIHARVFPANVSDELVDDIWQRAVPLNYHGLQTKTLTPEYHLIHACVHGFAWNAVPPIRWVADSITILSHSRVNWDLLADIAIGYDLHDDIAGHLNYLKNTWQQHVPDGVMDRLQQAPSSREKLRLLQDISMPPSSALNGLATRWAYYRYYCHSIGRTNLFYRILNFPKYMMMIRGHSSYRKSLAWGLNRLTLRTGQYFRSSHNKSEVP